MNKIDKKVLEEKRDLKAWIECLALWKEISEMPDTYTIKDSHGFKRNILNRLGIGKRVNSCPLCEEYWRSDKCPLGVCCSCYKHKYGYDLWESSIMKKGIHIQMYSQRFYNELIEVYRMTLEQERNKNTNRSHR